MLNLPHHLCHNPRELLRRWRQVAQAHRLRVNTLCHDGGFPILVIATDRAHRGEPAIYLSAGVHGDEAGATSGLLFWAQTHLQHYTDLPLMIFPCLNPNGLSRNFRVDERGLDMNRCFDDTTHPVCGPWLRWLQPQPPCRSLCLHEDYDAQGWYVYEINRQRQAHARRILDEYNLPIAVDERKNIDGHRAHRGLIHRRRSPLMKQGKPEALVLFELGCEIALTIETPSESALEDRIEVQSTVVEAFLQNWIEQWKTPS